MVKLLKSKEEASKKHLMPATLRHDDLFLVEFPKSGVTWLSYIIGNINILLNGLSDERVTFFNLTQHIPELDVTTHLATPRLARPGFRIIKSHATYNPMFLRVLYLVRDPRPVMVSYHRFLQQTGWKNVPLEQLIEDPTHGVLAWKEHVEGWLDKVSASCSFALIKYEDLLSDTAGEISLLYNILGISVSDDMLAEALSRSSIKTMQTDEKLYNSRHPRLGHMEFVRKGQAGGTREPLSPYVKKRIEELAGDTMSRLGYLI